MTTAFASCLIGTRAIAIWNKDPRVTVLVAISILFETVGFLFFSLKVTSEWQSEVKTCVISNVHAATTGIIIALSCDVFLLFSVLVGLFHRRPVRSSGIWRVLWNQGLVCIALVTIAEVPALVFFRLSLNPIVTLIPVPPGLYVTAIGATRMYRSLLVSRDHDVSPRNPLAARATVRNDGEARHDLLADCLTKLCCDSD